MTKQVIHLRPGDELTVVVEDATPPPDHIRGELGIDVSKWQGTIDWDAVAAHEPKVGFVGIRATMGMANIDPMFERNWIEAKRIGLQRAAYHYFSNNTFDGRSQFANFARQMGDDKGELPPVCDVEPTSGQVIENKAANTLEIKKWLDAVEVWFGKKPLIYTSGWAWGNCTTIPNWSRDYGLWLAQYTTAATPSIPRPWEKCQIWQYTSKGSMSGITGNVDLNRFGPYP